MTKEHANSAETSNPNETENEQPQQENNNFISSPSTKATFKLKRRVDHNEMERKRREVQRDEIEELRKILPGTNTSTRVSLVNIVIKARDYIENLKKRVVELEYILSHYQLGETIYSSQNKMLITEQDKDNNNMNKKLNLVGNKRMPPISPKASSINLPDHYPFPYIMSNYDVTLPPIITKPFPMGSPLVAISKKQNDSGPKQKKKEVKGTANRIITPEQEEAAKAKITEFFRAQKLSSVTPPPFIPVQQPIQTKGLHTIAEVAHSSSMSSIEDMKTNFKERRNSSLLFSSQNGVFWNKRDDSLVSPDGFGSMFAITEDIHADIRCGKCQRGIDNLVMIDCEKCKMWYHLRCVKVPPESIPLSWKCNECV